MWTLVGPFDGETTNETEFEKAKCVKAGSTYMLGRKERDIVINHKRISRDHLQFQVGEYTEQDAEDPAKRPTIKVQNVGTGNRKFVRDGRDIAVNRGSTMDLQDGDIIEVIHAVAVKVKWVPIVCYSPPDNKPRPDTQGCAKLGISVVWSFSSAVTHHLAGTYTLTPTIATSLIAKATIVRPDWLDTLISFGTSSDGLSQLEREFTIPNVSNYKPKLASSLPSSLKNFRSWEVSDERTDMLSDYRFIFVGERGHEAKDELRELVKCGGSTYECCPTQSGSTALHSVLAKAESKGKQPVLIGDETALLASVGKDGFDELVKEAANYELRFIPCEKITQAVIHVDRTYLDCSARNSGAVTQESMPDVILNTMPDELSTPPTNTDPGATVTVEPPKRKLVRRVGRTEAPTAASPREESQTQAETSTDTPVVPEPSVEPPPAKRPLVRRFRPNANHPVVEEDSLDLTRELSREPEPVVVHATQPRRNLKRRFGPDSQAPAAQPTSTFGSFAPAAEEEEPPHKKYRQLFDETDPDIIAKTDLNGYRTMFSTQPQGHETQEVAQGQSRGQRVALAAVPEEEEESTQTQMKERLQALKRKQAETDTPSEVAEATERALKKRAVESVGSMNPSQPVPTQTRAPQKSLSKPTSQTAAGRTKSRDQSQGPEGAEPGKPDTDENFLTAVASKKRGKKHEDDYDREFNDLRISKPTLPEPEEDWEIMDDFGDDSDLRGNFMVIVEIDVFKKGDTSLEPYRVAGGRADWEGRPNFKKFKQKAAGERRRPVELVCEQEEPWDDSMDIKYEDMFVDEPAPGVSVPMSDKARALSTQTKTQTQRRRGHDDGDSDDELTLPKPPADELALPPPNRSGRRSRAQSRAPSVEPQPTQTRRTGRSATAGRAKKSQPLFIESDEDDAAALSAVEEDDDFKMDMRGDDDDSDELTLPSTYGRRTQQSSRPTRKKRAMDDSDDELTIGSVNKRVRR